MKELRKDIKYPVLVVETEHLNLDAICYEADILKRFKICRNEQDIDTARKAFKEPKITYNFHFMQVAKRTEKQFKN